MSAYMVPEITCDGRRCGRPFIPCGDEQTIDKLRDQAHTEHWVSTPDGRDLCPSCHREEINPTPTLDLIPAGFDPDLDVF